MRAPAPRPYSARVAEFDPTDLPAQASARADKALRDKLARDEESADFRWLMSSKRGRRIVWRSLERAGVFRTSFSTNSMSMAFAEGNRNSGLALLDQIHRTCPEVYPVMLGENAVKDSNE
jgi:hypothetical protein